MNMKFIRKLPIPMDIKAQYPVTKEMMAVKEERDQELKRIFTGESNRFLLIIGPCSADNQESVLEYVGKLRRLQEQVADKIMMVPRLYTNKPRTTGIGYKGMLHQPDPVENPDLLKGIVAIRELHMRALADYTSAVPMRCFIRTTIATFPTFFPMLPLALVLWKTNNTALPPAVWIFPWE